ncbi:hypothetical protein [Streptomyces malaysiensis]|uniref:RNA polymerase sigma factor 70 region 4 type 2 domain-containing protein n=1 Tax=Streptomyces malaysiensis subsp. samsunensis TaxID=459658 RepID=A0A9X2M5Y0_STRMQ|nr:hypothetical protein [Streptomyces samsunensis]MCQ8836043.1 hypothetical protein [Streptomyces samsunensis]
MLLRLVHLAESLPCDRHEAFLFTQMYGLRYAKAAEVARCPFATVRFQVSWARSSLAEMMADDPDTLPVRGDRGLTARRVDTDLGESGLAHL